MIETIVINNPSLVYRKVLQDLDDFASHAMEESYVPQFEALLLSILDSLIHPLQLKPPSELEKSAITSGVVRVDKKPLEISPSIQSEILKLSQEFEMSEKDALSYWLLASDLSHRQWIERLDQLDSSTLTSSIPASARHFLVSEIESKLNILKELFRLRFDDRLSEKRREFVISYTNKLLVRELFTNLVSTFENELPKFQQNTNDTMQQAASYWHCIIADCIVFITSSSRILPQEVVSLAKLMKQLCERLDLVVSKVSPHIVNLSSFSQLFESGSTIPGISPEGVVRQVSNMLQAMTTVQVALFSVLLQNNEKIDRTMEQYMAGNSLYGVENAAIVTTLHSIFYKQEWQQTTFQSVAILGWASFLASNSDRSVGLRLNNRGTDGSNYIFAEVDESDEVIKRAIELKAFSTIVNVLWKYLPDRQEDPLLWHLYQRNFEVLFVHYASSLMVDVPTFADQRAMTQLHSDTADIDVGECNVSDEWGGDCLENIIDFASAICSRDSSFAKSFWPQDSLLNTDEAVDISSSPDSQNPIEEGINITQGACHGFLVACRDAAYKNPACFTAYMQLVASAAKGGPSCAQQAFHHVKQNPMMLNWDHFFAVMHKYQRLLSDAEKPSSSIVMGSTNYTHSTLSTGLTTSNGSAAFDTRRVAGAIKKFIRPKELEALSMIQTVIQEIVQDEQLALLFFHNHTWSPIPTFVSLLQCRVPSAFKGALMETLSVFVKIPDIAPFVWRHMDQLQILRTTRDTADYGDQDIAFELEHYESMSRTYPATRGFIELLNQLFKNPHAWSVFEGDGKIAAIQYYFDFVMENAFLKFDIRKYENEEEKWALVEGCLSIFRRILSCKSKVTGDVVPVTPSEESLYNQLFHKLLSGSNVLEKLLFILSSDGGVDSLENMSSNVHLEHAFFYCLDFGRKQAEARHGSAITFTADTRSNSSFGRSAQTNRLMKLSKLATSKELCVQLGLEILVLGLEQDQAFVKNQICEQLSYRSQLELLHNILRRYQANFVDVIQYIKYTKSQRIPHLSAVILRITSQRLRGIEMVNELMDSGASSDIMLGYMNRLLVAYDADEKKETNKYSNKRKSRSESMSLESNSNPLTFSVPLRACILDLLLENLSMPAPNLAHLLLGLLQDNPGSLHTNDVHTIKTGLDAILALLSSVEFGLETPDLAERCYRVINCLISQDYTFDNVLDILESPRYDYFFNQLRFFSSAFRIHSRRTSKGVISELNMRGWFFHSLSVYIHISLNKEPPRMSQINRLMELLLGQQISPTASMPADISNSGKLMLLHFFDQVSFNMLPPDIPENEQVVAMAESSTNVVDSHYYKWLKIEIEKFCEALQLLQTGVRSSSFTSFTTVSKRLRSSNISDSDPRIMNIPDNMETYVHWAINWNTYSERVAAESHALNGIRELVEVVVLEYLALSSEQGSDTPVMWRGIGDASNLQVRQNLISGVLNTILNKLATHQQASAQLFEILARVALLLFSQLRQSYFDFKAQNNGKNIGHSSFLSLIFRVIYNTSTATGNPVAARNARTLLYSCVVNILSMERESSTIPKVNYSEIGELSARIVDLISRDAGDGDDILSIALAVSALEVMFEYDSASVLKTCHERGYIIHFVDIFRKLCELDVVLTSQGTNASKKMNAIPNGITAATIGTMYECFLSLFARIGTSQSGALALLESGLLRHFVEMNNLPERRPKLVVHNISNVSNTARKALERAEAQYYRKWLPILRVLSSCCSSVPQNRQLGSQILKIVCQHIKLFSSALKLENFGGDKMKLCYLQELASVSFIFRYTIQFQDLCRSNLSSAKWEKLAQLIVKILVVFSAELLPPADSNAMSDAPSSFSWWSRILPLTQAENIDDKVRVMSCIQCEQYLIDQSDHIDIREGVLGILRLTVFEEEKLFLSRMILCNTVAFSASKMAKNVDENCRLLPGQTPLLSVLSSDDAASSSLTFAVNKSIVAVSTDPLWTQSPTISELTECYQLLISALISYNNLASIMKEGPPNTQENSLSYKSRAVSHECSWHPWKNLVENECDSLTFVAENMLVLLMVHFAHYLGPSGDNRAKSSLNKLLTQVLDAVHHLEDNPFIHALARKLRDLQ